MTLSFASAEIVDVQSNMPANADLKMKPEIGVRRIKRVEDDSYILSVLEDSVLECYILAVVDLRSEID